MHWKLDQEMSYAFKILDKHRRSLLFFIISIKHSKPKMKLMSKRQPVLIDEYNKAIKCPKIWIKHLLCKGAHLGRPIPAIRAMDEYILLQE